MTQNKISASLPEADKNDVLADLDAAKGRMPFLISLTKDERKTFRKMGPKSVQYVSLCLQGAQNFADLIPSAVDVGEFANDAGLVSQLWAVRIKLAALLESVDDSMMAAGSDGIKVADNIYGYLKTGARTNSNVKALVDEIGRRFEAQSRPRKKKRAGCMTTVL